MARPWEHLIGDAERLMQEVYRSPRRFRSRRALLLIDVYNRAFGERRMPLAESILEEPSSCGESGWDALPSIKRYLQLARTHGLPVVYTVGDERTHGVGAATLRATHASQEDDARPKPWGNTIIDPLRPEAWEPVFEKSRASGFYGTSLSAHLRAVGVDSLVILGETTSGCVRATAVDAYSDGFDVAVPEDGVFDRSPISHGMSLFDLNCKYATVTTPEATTDLLSGSQEVELDFSGGVVGRA